MTDRDRSRLKLLDFLGALSPEQIEVAKQLGIYKWDAWAKQRHAGIRRPEVAQEHPELLELADENE